MAQVKSHGGPKKGVCPCASPVRAVNTRLDHTINQIEVLRGGKGS